MRKFKEAGHNKIIVKIPKDNLYDDKQSGFLIDTSYNPAIHVKGEGLVEAVTYHKLYGHENEGIRPDIKVGDRVVFHYGIVNDGSNQDHNPHFLGNDDHYSYYMAEYHQVFMARSNNDEYWRMIGGWVLCDEHYENPVREYEYTDPLSGAPVKTRITLTSSGLVSEANVQRSSRIAKIHNIGPHRTTRTDLGLKKGDLVLFRRNLDGEIKVGRNRYILLQQHELLASL